MTTVEEVRRALAQATAATQRATRARVLAAGQVRRAERELETAERSGQRDELDRARARLEAARERAARAEGIYREARESLLGDLELAVPVTDPRELVGGLSADHPMLLFPVRIEVRFKSLEVDVAGVRRDQLWVRVFPDTVSIDAFGPELSEGEVDDAETYWREVWAARGDEDGERAAWHRLVASHGSGRGAWLVASLEPTNPDDKPLAPEDPAVEPSFPSVETAPSTWSRAPRAALLPDRFVFVTEADGERTEHLGRPVPPEVFTGPDPLAPAEEQVSGAEGSLSMPDELAWLTDFDRAVHDGLGIRIDLGPDRAHLGFDRLFAVGVRALADPEESATQLEELLRAHRFSGSGLAFVPQGTPTNNTEEHDAGRSRLDDPDVSFDALAAGPVPLEPDPRHRPDGQWFAELLGIDPDVLTGVPGAHGLDQRDARAMQALLWPATLGYLLGSQLEPVLSDASVEQARWFFSRHVRGRGSLPAFRVGRQPYGITTTTAFSRLSWLRPAPQRDLSARPGFLRGLYRLLLELDQDWDALVASVPSLGRGGDATLDAHETLLGILGLHATSAEFHYRYAESIDQLTNLAGLAGWFHGFWPTLSKAELDGPALALLARLGHDGERPPLLDLYFHGRQSALTGPLVDDRPLSETEPVRAWATGERNYLRWLRDAADTSLDAVRTATGFLDKTPNALLFLLARHAVILGYAESGWRLHSLAGYDAPTISALRTEPAFVHVAQEGPSESRFAPLYKHDPLISPGNDWSVAAQVRHVLHVSPATHVLRDQLGALELLEGASTARLERALVEHLDSVTYRLDAWWLGLVNLQLESMRGIPLDDIDPVDLDDDGLPDVPATRPGIHLGAYGWLENVRPNRADPVPVELPEDLAEVFKDGPPLQRDPANGGHLLAPSLNQAVTASVLRSAYLANASPTEPDAFTVNLSSERVRSAIEVLEGMRQGQSLAALLGYRFERGLHDASPLAEVDEFIHDLRRRFPLRADRLSSTVPSEDVSIEALEARNVVDGLRLVDHVEATKAFTYPFGLPDSVLRPDASPEQRAALEREIAALRDVRDAVGDLSLAEAVHHATQGSAERAGAALRTVETGQRPAELEVVRTPASGHTLTYRVGVHLDPEAVAGLGATPRATVAPGVDAYLAGLLPPLGSIACRVLWTDPATDAPQSATVSLASLGLRARDIVELLRTGEQEMTELDDRIALAVRVAAAVRPDAQLTIAYREAGPGQIPIFEVATQCANLRSIVSRSRALRPSDVVPPGEATTDLDESLVADDAPLRAVHAQLTALRGDAEAFVTLWEARLAATVPDDATPPATTEAARELVLDTTDAAVDDAVALLERGARLAVPGSGWGQALASRGGQFARTVARVVERVETWTDRLAAVDAALADYDALGGAVSDEERFAALAAIEGQLVPASVGLTEQLGTPALERAAVGDLRDAFAARLAALRSVRDTTASGLAALRTEVQSHLPLDDVDAAPFELASTETAMITLVEDVLGSVRSLAATLSARDAAATQAFADHDAAIVPGGAGPAAALEALQAAARALLGEGFAVVPTFSVPASAAASWALSLGDTAGLLAFATAGGRDFPIEDWLHSAARVREPLQRLEQVGLVAGALVGVDPQLVPAQLPYRPGEAWLALEHPPEQDLAGEHLLYSAVYPDGASPTSFDPAGTVSGLLVDEWTEVLPEDEATVGLAFHYDQPSSEAPQSLLLVTPASAGKAWQWADVRDAIPDTMRLARQRAVEPAHLDEGAIARFLPATVTAITTRGISIGLAYAISNDVAQFMEVNDD